MTRYQTQEPTFQSVGLSQEPVPRLGTLFLLPVAFQEDMPQPSPPGSMVNPAGRLRPEGVHGDPEESVVRPTLRASRASLVPTAQRTAGGRGTASLSHRREMDGQEQHRGTSPGAQHLGRDGRKASGRLVGRGMWIWGDTD